MVNLDIAPHNALNLTQLDLVSIVENQDTLTTDALTKTKEEKLLTQDLPMTDILMTGPQITDTQVD